MPTLTTEPLTLTKSDRCDRCGAAAKAQAVLPSGGELLFCGHHARKHADQLRRINAKLYFP